ncbi:menaquinol oxidoreductase complex Cbc4, cytochrome b subunit, putative [Geotalea daltonii FRC-32]|uniref:Menaquinol oxidoreductase complex Cbc4, cytochrome b subunit, putative n=1 Tax=Geotalea daltonii (strain DSM 22248 / JCM 15807 / FRC-32) TaxID=316067 RepID=B9M2J9_GEODF|nr:NrfD/PsrC family molybdoenzyme membrane anchor subunit [Geotalea daltonii]ACM19378.1 menaquinol oxidoreductase complex Cbc4, cytochrome b subunit, putative [Geotalea daltonii FRC-32]
MVHGEAWTLKEFFVYPNEYIYWTIQIVMYPFMTGLVAGAFVLSSLYHVFGVKQLKDIARFSLVFSFALLPVAMMPLMLHLQQPQRGFSVMLTPHFTSAIAAFGIVFSTYGMIVASELWFVYRRHFVTTATQLATTDNGSIGDRIRRLLFSALTLGARDVSEEALARDEKAVKVLAAVGIPVACFLHGYAGFIFGSVKANALWMTPLMPVIFICSAVVSGIALCILTYIATMEIRKLIVAWQKKHELALLTHEELKSAEIHVVTMTSRYLIMFLVLAITLELLDLIFRGYTAVKSWDILRSVIYGRDFVNIFILQYGLGNLVPFILFLIPGLTIRRAAAGSLLVLLGVFMMRWNVVIGGQAFSSSFAGFMHYQLPIWPHDMETFKEGLFGALMVAITPFALFWLVTRVLPVFNRDDSH